MSSICVAFMSKCPGEDRDRAWAVKTTRRGPSNPEYEEILKPRKSERAEVKRQGRGLIRGQKDPPWAKKGKT